jgi:hypothetical protein
LVSHPFSFPEGGDLSRLKLNNRSQLPYFAGFLIPRRKELRASSGFAPIPLKTHPLHLIMRVLKSIR